MKDKKSKSPRTDNPENLPSDPHNSLFGSKKEQKKGSPATDELRDGASSGAKKRQRPAVLKEDPAAAKLRAQKKMRKSEGSSSKPPSSGKPPAPGSQKASKPHASEVEKSNRLWEKLRSDKTEGAERERLVDEVLALFSGKVLNVLQKHDAARVLQSVFKHGTAAQRDALMDELQGHVLAVAKSHYGHFLLISILRHGTTHHKQRLVKELVSHAAELVVHAEGSAVLQILYDNVASQEERTAMYRTLWGKEISLFHDGRDGASTLAGLFGADPACKPRVLRQLGATLDKAARKGLALTSLVQRGGAELLEEVDAAQRAELVGTFREHAAHIMHTRDGCRIAIGCVRHGDAKDRKGLLKSLKGFCNRAALDPHGALVLVAALESVDDTVLLTKGVLAELIADLPALAVHPHGQLPFLALLAPRSSRYFHPDQTALLGEAGGGAHSKKEPAVRRGELLAHVLPHLLDHCAAHAASLAVHPHGAHLLYEVARVGGGLDASVTEASAKVMLPNLAGKLQKLFDALAASAVRAAPTAAAGDDDDGDDGDGDAAGEEGSALVTNAYGAPSLKRLVKEHGAFAEALLGHLEGKLLKWAKRGAGWVVLALLESKATGAAVKAELKGGAKALAKSSAAGCRSLGDALK